MVSDEQRREQAQEIRALLAKYARISRGGRPMLCGPSVAERRVRDTYEAWNDVPKPRVIFDSRERAQAFADAVYALLGGRRQEPFACSRSKHGHHHLRAKKEQ